MFEHHNKLASFKQQLIGRLIKVHAPMSSCTATQLYCIWPKYYNKIDPGSIITILDVREVNKPTSKSYVYELDVMTSDGKIGNLYYFHLNELLSFTRTNVRKFILEQEGSWELL